MVPSPDESRVGTNVLTGVAGSSAGAVWAVGDNDGESPTVEYWDGTDWRLVTTPRLQTPVLTDIIALSASDVWAVGGQLFAQASAMNWNGAQWQLPPMPVLEASGMLNGVAAAGPRDVWAAGFYSSGQQSLAENWNGQAWRVTTTPRLMRSGKINAITALPGSYVLTWAARVAPFGFVYDVRVKAPNASHFGAFRTGVSSISATFTPAAGPGTYQVEARLRKGGTRSGWSPPLSLMVTG